MRIPFLTAAITAALSVNACNTEATDPDVNADGVSIENAALNDAIGADPADASMPIDAPGFANAVAASDLYEIESSKLAGAKATSTDIKAFAEKLQADHTKSTADLKTAAGKSNVTFTPSLDPEKQTMLDELRAAPAGAFDRLFVQQQKTAHQKVLKMRQHYEAGGDNEAVKGFAATAATVVQSHLNHLDGLTP